MTSDLGELHTPASIVQSGEPVISIACLECRQRHLKCDGRRPCGRCVDSQSNCVFVPSRRGQRNRNHGATASMETRRTRESTPESVSRTALLDAIGSTSNALYSKSLFRSITPPDARPLATWRSPESRPSSAGRQYARQSTAYYTLDRCISSYYYNFHHSHPLLLPQAHLKALTNEASLEPLLAVMHWVGSLYIAPEGVRRQLLDAARLAVNMVAEDEATGFTVQAMAVMVIALDGSGQQAPASQLLAKVKRILMTLGMDRNQFSIDAGAGSRVLEESWRRTWWELYVLDGMFAGAHRITNFTLFMAPTDVKLPCEEGEFASASIPDPLTIDDLNDRDLSDDGHQFSSFAYRILSAQNLGKVMHSLDASEADSELHQQLEVLLASWRQNIPPWKQDSLQRDGSPDEMMFQAHMMNHTTSILLHRSRANLDSYSTRTINACAEEEQDMERPPFAAVASVDQHSQHVMRSASEICKLITHRTALTRHSHFFVCAVVLSAIVQLSVWSMQLPVAREEALREQVRLCIGALQQISTVWQSAMTALGQIKRVAGEIHALKKQSRQMEQFLVEVEEDDVMNAFGADPSLIGGMEMI